MNKEFVSGAGVQEYSPCSIKWFWKALRHYADFSGRARGTEYLSFVILNFLLFMAWVFAVTFLYMYVINTSEAHLSIIGQAIPSLYMIAVCLPSLSVTVRCLHDIGKSGWWLFIACIPVVGMLWLSIKCILKDDKRTNRYGCSPRMYGHELTDGMKFNTIGITMIVGYMLSTSAVIINGINHPIFIITLDEFIEIATGVAMVVAGALLCDCTSRENITVRLRTAIIIILAVTSVSFTVTLVHVSLSSEEIDKVKLAGTFVELISYASIIALACSILFKQNTLATAWITFVTLTVHLFLKMHLSFMNMSPDAQFVELWMPQVWIISHISLFMFAAMFLPLWKSTPLREIYGF